MFLKQGEVVRTLKSLSVTRWTAHESSRKGIEDELHNIIKTLHELTNECDAKVSSEAKVLLKAVLDFEFIFGLSVLKIILPHTSHLSSLIQSVTIDVLKVKENADLTIETLKSCRNSESFNSIWELSRKKCEIVKNLMDELEIEIDFQESKLPRQRPSRRRVDTSEVTADNHEFTDLKEFNRVTHYYHALDKIIFELKA